jgi:predicted DsbA family dithiol-disulfide isomerase
MIRAGAAVETQAVGKAEKTARTEKGKLVLVEIWSDVVCPWCYIGKRRFEGALEHFSHAAEVEVRWRSFELDPNAPRCENGDNAARLARKYGITLDEAKERQARVTATAAAEGLDYHLEQVGRANTFDAHRLLHLAAGHGRQDQLKERLLRAHLCEGAPIGEPEVLQRLAVEVGLDPDEVAQVLATDAYRDEVRADERRAVELGVSGVPFFVVDGRYAVSGAQDGRRLVQLLDRAWLDSRAVQA